MRKLGLKLWSINKDYIIPAQKLFERNIYDYIELYTVPNSFEDYHAIWKNLNIPFIIHAPHFGHGVNLALKEKEQFNLEIATQAKKWADTLNAPSIIFHPGINGTIHETIRQLQIINDHRILIENKPHTTTLGSGYICNGHLPEDIKNIKESLNIGVCLDIGHCFCAANSLKIDKFEFLQKFLELEPRIIHLSDGKTDATLDEHRHFGMGNFDFKKIFNLIPEDIPISIETKKESAKDLNDFTCDANFIRNAFYDLDFRKVEEKDLLPLFELANDPLVRNGSLNTKNITLSEHKIWFAAKLKDPNCIFFIITSNDEFVGYSRFDLDNNKMIFSLAITAPYRSKGIGTKILSHTAFLVKLIKKLSIIGYIKKDNLAALKYSKKAGFLETGIVKEIKGFSCIEVIF